MTSEFNDKEKQLEILNDFIRSNPKPEELKRALAIKLVWQNDTYNSRKERLCVSVGFISKWKKAFERHVFKKNTIMLGREQRVFIKKRKRRCSRLVNSKRILGYI